jgi:hypothetical protein
VKGRNCAEHDSDLLQTRVRLVGCSRGETENGLSGVVKPFLFGTCNDRALLSNTPPGYFAMAPVDVPTGASSAILKPSDPVSEGAVSVQGPNFDNPLDLQQFISSYERIGFQANSLGRAIHITNKMVYAFQYVTPTLTTYYTQ